MRALLDKVDPKFKKWAAGGLAAGGVVVLVALTTGPSNTEQVKKGRDETIRNVLTSGNTRRVSLEALDAKLSRITNDVQGLKRDVTNQGEQLGSARSKGLNDGQFNTRLKKLSEAVARLESENKSLQQQLLETEKQVIRTVNEAVSGTSPSDFPDDMEDGESLSDEVNVQEVQNPNKVFETAIYPDPVITESGQKRSDSAKAGNSEGSEPRVSGNIVTISQIASGVEELEAEEKDDPGLFLASGSILQGVILNGMDAPTNSNARKEPFPSLLRLQKEAILPNYFLADIRECFLIMSGYGDLSSERAYLRGETLSCVRDDGGVIEASLASYAVGEDGKAGVRGRLVSKQGAIIGRSMLAGFLSGAAGAFSAPQVPALNTKGDSQALYQSLMSQDALSNAGAKGASEALAKIADYYIERAEGVHPVIEIDAGRQIEVIVTKGAKLSFKGGKA
ncbi:TraB/VirB10 family protein [Pseudovibrio sp. Ad37]|uniref:TraB/VirB10 family protein n=1 Tax=Pseudovibrio sp. Ad37 TaxID=989422 RepID=UPI0007AE7B1A|nr:TraB/VirB10 family protein [Pseudovibrio sp. Ad37]KZL22690.1 Bacterial conjugation TrbI-like protein [Pseudovibrio sp. Ad37]